MKRRWFLGFFFGVLVTVGIACTNQAEKPVNLTISAAASLTDALEEVVNIYQQQESLVKINLNLGSSGSLQQQIEQGAPVDVFISAASRQMDALGAKGLLLDNTRLDLLSNQVVLIVAIDNNNLNDFPGLTANEIERIALGDPDSVPAGEYGKEVLTTLQLYDTLTPKFIFAKDVRQVLTYVETGNVDGGIVYASDAKISDGVKVVATAPENSHSPTIYPIAVIKDSSHPQEAQAFLEFLSSNGQAKAVFSQYGFTLVD